MEFCHALHALRYVAISAAVSCITRHPVSAFRCCWHAMLATWTVINALRLAMPSDAKCQCLRKMRLVYILRSSSIRGYAPKLGKPTNYIQIYKLILL